MPSPPTQTTLLKTNKGFCYVKAPPGSLAVIMLSYRSIYPTELPELTRQSLSDLSSGGGLWPDLPAQSLNNRFYDYMHTETVFRIKQVGLKPTVRF